jgi:hypothetical protein
MHEPNPSIAPIPSAVGPSQPHHVTPPTNTRRRRSPASSVRAHRQCAVRIVCPCKRQRERQEKEMKRVSERSAESAPIAIQAPPGSSSSVCIHIQAPPTTTAQHPSTPACILSAVLTPCSTSDPAYVVCACACVVYVPVIHHAPAQPVRCPHIISRRPIAAASRHTPQPTPVVAVRQHRPPAPIVSVPSASYVHVREKERDKRGKKESDEASQREECRVSLYRHTGTPCFFFECMHTHTGTTPQRQPSTPAHQRVYSRRYLRSAAQVAQRTSCVRERCVSARNTRCTSPTRPLPPYHQPSAHRSRITSPPPTNTRRSPASPARAHRQCAVRIVCPCNREKGRHKKERDEESQREWRVSAHRHTGTLWFFFECMHTHTGTTPQRQPSTPAHQRVYSRRYLPTAAQVIQQTSRVRVRCVSARNTPCTSPTRPLPPYHQPSAHRSRITSHTPTNTRRRRSPASSVRAHRQCAVRIVCPCKREKRETDKRERDEESQREECRVSAHRHTGTPWFFLECMHTHTGTTTTTAQHPSTPTCILSAVLTYCSTSDQRTSCARVRNVYVCP